MTLNLHQDVILHLLGQAHLPLWVQCPKSRRWCRIVAHNFEIVAAEVGMRPEAPPLLTLWEHVVVLFRARGVTKKRDPKLCKSQPMSKPVAAMANNEFDIFTEQYYSMSSNQCINGSQNTSLLSQPADERQLDTNGNIVGDDLNRHLLIYAKSRPRLPKVQLLMLEGNQAVCKILVEGRSNALLHVHRARRVNADLLYEIACNMSMCTTLIRSCSWLTF